MFNALKCILLEKCFVLVVVITSEGPLLMTEDILPVLLADCHSTSRYSSAIVLNLLRSCDITCLSEFLQNTEMTKMQQVTARCAIVVAGCLMRWCLNFHDANAFLSLHVIFLLTSEIEAPFGCAVELA